MKTRTTRRHRRARKTLLVGLGLLLSQLVIQPAVTAGAMPASDTGRYFVLLSASPLAAYEGGVAGLSATNPAAIGQTRLNANSAASQAYLAYLGQQQSALKSAIASALGRNVSIAFSYRTVLDGMAIAMSATDAGRVAALAGVARVVPDKNLQLLTDVGPTWIGAQSVWGGTGGGLATKGEGLVAGIIDSGINHDHPSFAAVGGDGYHATNPKGRYFGVCDPVTGAPLCNAKLIGMYDFTGTGPEDDNGHGSHTSSTVAGNVLDMSLVAPTITVNRHISGVAPHANIIMYKACVTTPAIGTCPQSATVAGIEQATLDGVDVINFSIGGGASNPWTDLNAIAFLNAQRAGVYSAVAAGNSGPTPATVGSPADAPWVAAAAASTHNRKFVNALTGMTGGTNPPATLHGLGVTSGYGPATIVYAGDYGYPLCGDGPANTATGEAAINPFPAGTFHGEIVVCDRGTYGRVEKAQNVAEGGAGGYVLANDAASGDSLIGDAYAIPGVSLTYNDGVKVKTWLATAGTHSATIAGESIDLSASNGDIMASFSSRGPDSSVPTVLKPDLSAPGVDILAAFATPATNPLGNNEYAIESGTSMASPHTAGSALLIRALHPSWTPDQVRSALMTTSVTSLRKEDATTAATPFDRGAGRVDLTLAGKAGLLFNETGDNYQAADPSMGGDPTTLNLASLSQPACAETCTWTRTVSGSAAGTVTWTASATTPTGMTLTVSPSSFSVAPGATRTITFTANVSGLPRGAWRFAEVRLTPNNTAVPTVHIPVAVTRARDSSTTPPAPPCDIPETVVATAAPDSTVPASSDVLSVTVAGLYPTLGGDAVPNLTFGIKVSQLALNGALPPNQYWQVTFDPPGAPAGTDYFVKLATDTTGAPAFAYGTQNLAANSFAELGTPDYGSYSLTDSTIHWVMSASKLGDPRTGDVIRNIAGEAGLAQPGLLTSALKSTAPGQYTLGACPASTPDLKVTAMSAGSQKPKAGDRVVINTTVTNSGPGGAGASKTEIRLGSATVLGLVDTPALASGASATVAVTWDTRGLNGSYVITATADRAGTVTEGNEANNLGTLTVTVRGNKVQNQSFEQPNSAGTGPDAWQGSSTGAGTASSSSSASKASDGSHSVSISGTGGSVVLAGMPTWTSSAFAVTPGELLTISVDVQCVGLSSAPSLSLAYLGPAGDVLNTVKVLTAPLTTTGFTTLSSQLQVPLNVTSARLVLAGFAPTDTHSGGTITFDNVGVWSQ